MDDSKSRVAGLLGTLPTGGTSRTLLALGLVATSLASLCIYRLYFSPLSQFPGPKIAAITSLYAFYHDVIRGGQYVWAIEEMHKKYGPIVRIRPEVLHCNDPYYIDTLFPGPSQKRTRYKLAAQAIGTPGTVLSTTSHSVHRHRRAALNPYFSKQSIGKLEPIVQDALSRLRGRLREYGDRGEAVVLNHAFKALTSDVVAEYAFGVRKGDLDAAGFNRRFWDTLRRAAEGVHFATFAPLVMDFLNAYPRIGGWVSEALGFLYGYDAIIYAQIERIRNGDLGDDVTSTIFHGLLDSDLPESEKATQRLTREGRTLFAAGTDTTAMALASISYLLLSHPEKLKILKKELEGAIPDPDSLPTVAVESLPYLSAVIQEGLRLHPPSTLRMERVNHEGDLYYKDPKGKEYRIPTSTPVGMTTPLINRLPSIFPDPFAFRPERYLEDPTLKRYSLVFSKGTYSCLGMNLAYQELYMVLAGIFRTYDLYDPSAGAAQGPTLELYHTTREDVDMVADFGTYGVKRGSLGVRVLVR